ncbi:golvesin C-terminal-like domain-containing protein [Thermocatellispora tengchongensis]|uniref:golvesin C-terminal-like domain-containing protein n=1 Tax=Thermocatellispora tengchongensis TaxID=1073253 RepID=UPI00362526EE
MPTFTRMLGCMLALLLAVSIGPPAVAAPGPVEVVSTTRDAGYRETGTWTQAQRTGYLGGTTRFTREVGATASWTLTAPADDEYAIGVWIPASSDVNDPAVTYGWNGTSVRANQAAFGDAWHTLGTVRLARGATLTVTVTARTAGKVTRADAVRLSSTRPSQDVLVNQSGYDLTGPKRFTAPRATDGDTFTITREGSAEVLFRGTVKGGVGDFTGFRPAGAGPYVVTVTGDLGTGTSHPFGIGPYWTYRVSIQRAVDFMVQSRCAHGDATKLVFTDPAGNHCNRGNTGVAWRDDHQFSFTLQSLIELYLSNPDAFTRSPGTGRYDGLAISTTPDAPEIVKLINWGVDLYLQGKVNHTLLKEQLAWFVHAYPHLSKWIPREQYVKARDHLVANWSNPARDRWNWYDIPHSADLFQTYTIIGTGKGQFPPGHSIVPNLMMYDVARRDGLPDPGRYLNAARAQVDWIVANLDWNDPATTKGQRMSEHVTMESLAYYAERYPDPELTAKIEQWADVAIARSQNMWDFRKYSDSLWIIPEFNEPGNVAGLPAAALAAARVIDDPAKRRRCAASPPVRSTTSSGAIPPTPTSPTTPPPRRASRAWSAAGRRSTRPAGARVSWRRCGACWTARPRRPPTRTTPRPTSATPRAGWPSTPHGTPAWPSSPPTRRPCTSPAPCPASPPARWRPPTR